MRSGVRFRGATTIELVARGAANPADLEPAVQLQPALWSGSGRYIGGHAGGGYGQKSFSNLHVPSVYGGGVDTPMVRAGGQIGYNWQKNSWVFGLKLDASSAVSNGTNTCLTASGIVLCANCKASPNVFVTGDGRLGYAFGAQGLTLAYVKEGVAWQNNRGDVINNNEFGQYRRRRARLLQGARRGLSRHTPPAMLGAQDRERPGQGPTLGAGHHKEGFARGLLGGPSVRRSGDRRPRRKALRQVWLGGRMLGQGSRRTAGLSTIFLPNIGITCAPPIPSRAYSPRGDTGPCGRRVLRRQPPPGRWCSSW
ncbi:hypothetical protein ACVJGD_008599 [Bradyrhizobium sp. USDA 10063]